MAKRMVEEGRVRIEIPDPEEYRSVSGDYVPSLAEVFYNPQMEFCRDISVSVAQVVSRELGGLRVCDPLAGSGIRGIRYAAEIEGVTDVLINDRSRAAYELMLRNVELNPSRVRIAAENDDANVVMLRNRGRFNLIDLDPFGSPARFIESACASVARTGMIALTATDTGPLCGAHPRTCIRRYGAQPLRTEYCHELGIRTLIGFCQRVAGKYDLALEPVLVHSTRHYFRIYLRAKRSASLADTIMRGQGYISHCFSCGRRWTFRGLPRVDGCECGGAPAHSGPLWTGPLWNRDFLENVIRDLSGRTYRQREAEINMLSLCLMESGGPPTFYDINALASMAGVSPPRIKWVIECLRKSGRFASRTHFSPTGIRTEAGIDELMALLQR